MKLETKYLGLNLKNPIIPSAGPLSREIDNIKKMEDAEAAAVVLYSLFEEQIEHETLELHHHTSLHADSHAEATNYFPDMEDYSTGPDEYLEHLKKAKDAVDIPIIASLNGKSLGGWTEYAKKIEQAGADALELNIYKIAADVNKSGSEIEKMYIDIVKEVTKSINIPVAVKLSPYFSSMAWMANQIVEAGAKGLVLFNRFYQPDIDLEELEIVPNVVLSSPDRIRLRLRWIAILHDSIKTDLAATGGVFSEEDIIKLIMTGAQVTQMLSALLKHGIEHIKTVLTKLIYWGEEHEYESLEQMCGSMCYKNIPDPSQIERANYMSVLNSYK